ncbi:MAG: hypothetical protein Q8Q59_06485 [Luteolibacter sp.]|jgi:hypothetical protein|nr:hypothetical protein [Luteolibacter sp.]
MNPPRIAARLLLLVIAGFLVSCIDSREEFWLEANGSGRAEITCSLPAAAARLHGGNVGIDHMVATFLRETPAITRSSHAVRTEGERTTVTLKLAFDSAMDLAEIASSPAIARLPGAATHLAGEVTTKLSGRTLHLKRSVSPGKALPGAAFLPASQLDGFRLVTIMHLPAAVKESNATRVENGGRTLVWETPMALAVISPVVNRFQIDIPIPWTLISCITIPLTLACGVVILRLRKPTSKPDPGQVTP